MWTYIMPGGSDKCEVPALQLSQLSELVKLLLVQRKLHFAHRVKMTITIACGYMYQYMQKLLLINVWFYTTASSLVRECLRVSIVHNEWSVNRGKLRHELKWTLHEEGRRYNYTVFSFTKIPVKYVKLHVISGKTPNHSGIIVIFVQQNFRQVLYVPKYYHNKENSSYSICTVQDIYMYRGNVTTVYSTCT